MESWIIQSLIGFVVAIIGWAVRSLIAKVEDLQQKAHDIELSLARDYHNKDDLAQLFDSKLKPIADLLNKAVDWIESQSGGVPIKRNHL